MKHEYRAKEWTIEEMGVMSKRIIEGRSKMTDAFEAENIIKTRVLQQVFDVMKDCLPHISSKLRFKNPYDSGFALVSRGVGNGLEELYLAEEGFFFVYDDNDIERVTPAQIIRDRWDLREIVLAIADEMKANLYGQLRKIEGVQRTTEKIGAVATLLAR